MVIQESFPQKKLKLLLGANLITLQIGEEVTIELHEGHLVIKPVIKVDEDFAENLLEELIAAGFSGEELVAKFKEVKQQVLKGEKSYL